MVVISYSAKICKVSITLSGKFGQQTVSNVDRVTGSFVKCCLKLCELTRRGTGHNFRDK